MTICSICHHQQATDDQWSGPLAHKDGCECPTCTGVCWGAGSNCDALLARWIDHRKALELRTIDFLARMSDRYPFDVIDGIGREIRSLLFEWRAAAGDQSVGDADQQEKRADPT